MVNFMLRELHLKDLRVYSKKEEEGEGEGKEEPVSLESQLSPPRWPNLTFYSPVLTVHCVSPSRTQPKAEDPVARCRHS